MSHFVKIGFFADIVMAVENGFEFGHYMLLIDNALINFFDQIIGDDLKSQKLILYLTQSVRRHMEFKITLLVEFWLCQRSIFNYVKIEIGLIWLL